MFSVRILDMNKNLFSFNFVLKIRSFTRKEFEIENKNFGRSKNSFIINPKP